MQTRDRDKILEELANCVITGDYESVQNVAKEALDAKCDPVVAIEQGLAKGLKVVGDSFGRGDAFLPDLVQAAAAMKAGVEIIKMAIPKGFEIKRLGSIVIGTVEGDIHDIGKNILIAMFEANGFTVHDLGADVPSTKFVEMTGEVKPNIVAMSALLTTTLARMPEVIKGLDRAGLRRKVKVMVGGTPVTKEWADEMGADAYGTDASEGIIKAKQIVGAKSK